MMLAASAAMPVAAQTSGTNSSYSRFGLGLLAEQSQGAGRSMGGVGQALRAGNRLNTLNPASYSSIDSLTFLFDVGMSLQRTRMSIGPDHQSANNTSFDYVTMGFRLGRNIGMSLGFMPYSNIGYSFSQTSNVSRDAVTGQSIDQTLAYAGSGGLHDFFVGVGWRPFAGLSIGGNFGYVWGNVTHQVTQSFAENGTTNTTAYSSLTSYYNSSVKTWKGDVALQYQQLLNSKNRITLGATVGIGHTIGSKASMLRTSLNGDTIRRETPDAFQLPMTYSVGLAWEHAERLLVAADVIWEQWAKCTTPQLRNTGADLVYEPAEGTYRNRMTYRFGAEYVPARYDRSYVHRINYRIGAVYSTPYLNINGQQGPREYGVTAGVGLPITNKINSRSYVNVGLAWAHRQPSTTNMIAENVYQINVGLTFNERWFAKWKFR